MMALMKVPISMTTASLTTSSPSITASFRTMFRRSRSTPPKMQPIRGMRTFCTSVVVMAPKAVAMITPTAMSITLPRMMNSLNSFSKLDSFFIAVLPFVRILFQG